MDDILVLAIETSCDETSAAVVKNGRDVLSNVISSQIDVHKRYGGVVPEIASRKHIENISAVVDEALLKANTSFKDMSCIAVTNGPGLVGALLVGVSYAKALSFALGTPLTAVNHIEGHIYANFLGTDFEPPFVCLIVSGGHTHLAVVTDYGSYKLLGKTRDDAAGEAYDKVARALSLPYPGGPQIDMLAASGNPAAIPFPRAAVAGSPYDFSFSGLKSAVLNYINKCGMTGTDFSKADVAASFQEAVVDVLVERSVSACQASGFKKLALAGGVSSNSRLRKKMTDACSAVGISLSMPRPVYCTDNAAMIGACGYYQFKINRLHTLDLNAVPNLELIV